MSADCQCLTAFSNTCWGGQLATTFPESWPWIFSNIASSHYIILCSSNPISWKSIKQDWLAIISCKAEIMTTNKYITEIKNSRHHIQDLDMSDAFECLQFTMTIKPALTGLTLLQTNAWNTWISRRNLYTKHTTSTWQKLLTFPASSMPVISSLRSFVMVLTSFGVMTPFVLHTNFKPFNHAVPTHMQLKQDLPYYSNLSLMSQHVWVEPTASLCVTNVSYSARLTKKFDQLQRGNFFVFDFFLGVVTR